MGFPAPGKQNAAAIPGTPGLSGLLGAALTSGTQGLVPGRFGALMKNFCDSPSFEIFKWGRKNGQIRETELQRETKRQKEKPQA